MADGLPSNPPTPPSTSSWISVNGSGPASAPVPAPKVTQMGDSFFVSNPESSDIVTPLPINDSIQIGNSFFQSDFFKTTPVSQVGLSYEDRSNLSDLYVYLNHLFANNIFAEMRLYGAYNYQATNSNFASLPVSNQANPPGYGFVGILGYNVPLNSNVSLLPYIRLSYYHDFFAVYNNSDGNTLNTNQYMAQGGLRLSLKVNNVFAVYGSYWIGYQDIYLNGGGAYAGGNDPQVSGIASSYEIGAPYRMTTHFSFIPYIAFSMNANSPNNSASTEEYKAIAVTNTNTLFGAKVSYDF